jgi:hypothetical protein
MRVRRLERGGFAYIGAVEAGFDTIKIYSSLRSDVADCGDLQERW